MGISSKLIEELDAMVARHHLLKHPFYQEWTAGTLERARLRDYAAQYYRHVEAFPRYLSAIHSRSGDLATRQAILENLVEEERGPENHPELWMRFAEGAGVSRAEVIEAPVRPTTARLVETFTRVSRELPVAAGLAAIYAYESQIPAIAEAKIDGLKRFYGIEDDRSLAFFRVHQEADTHHSRTDAELIEREVGRSGGAQVVLGSARDALTALWGMLDGV